MHSSETLTPRQETCTICGRRSQLDNPRPQIRESYCCQGCGASLRYRAQASAIIGALRRRRPEIHASNFAELVDTKTWNAMRVYEPGIIGPFRKYLRTKPNYTQSFYWPDVGLGETRNGIVCQDLTKTTFGMDVFDLIITSDIFEHVRNPRLGFAELFRILRPGGLHVFSVPAQEPLPSRTVSRVNTDGSDDIYILDAMYHGSGDGGRSLVYTDFGRDVVEMLATIGFETDIHEYKSEATRLPSVYTFISAKYTDLIVV